MNQYFDELAGKIKSVYENAVTMDEAEKLAAEFLHAQMIVAEELRVADLDARMQKSGYKAVSAAVYMENATKTEKKPSDTLLQNTVDLNELVQKAREAYDKAEVEKDALQNYFNIFREAHIYFRGIAKGRFE